MFTQEELNKRYNEELKKIEESIKSPNILIIGNTGVGKSSLINSIFGKYVAEVSDSEPSTRGIKEFKCKDVVLFDTEGLELDKVHEEKFDNVVLGEIKKRNSSSDFNERIHLIWYLISASSDRITNYQLEIYEKLKSFEIPIAIVFTKCDLANESNLDEVIKCFEPKQTFVESFENLDENPFFVSNDFSEEDKLSPRHLVDWSIKNLPESLRFAFISSQKISLEQKYNLSKSIIYQHTGGNALVAFTPIPFSDAPILIASQSGMLIRIVKIYDLEQLNIKSFMMNTGASLIASNLGKSIVASLFKLIPGIGTAIGGILNASVASAITYAMGTAMNKILYSTIEKVLKGDAAAAANLIENFDKIYSNSFNQEFKMKKNE